MNILPYVILFIFILGISSSGLFQSYQVTKLGDFFLHGYLVAEREARNAMEAHTYASSKPKAPPSPNPQKAKTLPLPDPEKPFTSFRSKHITENSKLNIAPLFFHEDPLLKETLTHLLKEVYSHAPFMDSSSYDVDSLCKEIVETLISMNKHTPRVELSLTKMQFPNEVLGHVWYKMLRGTNPYYLDKKDGWPPLSTLLIIHSDKKRLPICFSKASIPILTAHLGQEATQDILEKEYANYLEGRGNSPLEPQELDNILSKHTLTGHKKLLQPKSAKKLTLITQGKDKPSGIIVELSPLKP
jgi:hypothetical protein